MWILYIIIAIIAIPFILAVFAPAEYNIQKSVIINKPLAEVFNYLRYVRNAENFSKWVMMDPNSKKEMKGTDGTVGFVYGWDSDMKQVGKGEQEIKAIKENERIDYELRFYKPFQNTSYSYYVTSDAGANQTQVQWVFRGIRNYPMKVMHIVLNLKKMLGKDMETSLANLKNLLENN